MHPVQIRRILEERDQLSRALDGLLLRVSGITHRIRGLAVEDEDTDLAAYCLRRAQEILLAEGAEDLAEDLSRFADRLTRRRYGTLRGLPGRKKRGRC